MQMHVQSLAKDAIFIEKERTINELCSSEKPDVFISSKSTTFTIISCQRRTEIDNICIRSISNLGS